MDLESNIRQKINSLKPTVTTIYSNNGEVHQETRDEKGCSTVTKLNCSSPGYVIDEVPDLTVSKILPWLYLGSQDIIHDYELLKLNAITHILSIGIPCPPHPDITCTYIEALDLAEFRIADIFQKCFDIIDTVRRNSGIVYVHCNAGVSRSPTIVAAYLIQHERITVTEAINQIKLVRPKIHPNEGFLKQLQEFERQTLQYDK